jgi:hypothetical protein
LSDVDDRKSSISPATRECSVKLVDINDLSEPLAKRPRTSDPVSLGRKSSNEATNNVFTSKLSDPKKGDPLNSFFSSGVDGAMKLLGAKRESKVTISPVRNKDAPLSGLLSASNSATGSVTITKLSTGSSLSIESKDLKSILGATKTSISGDKDKLKADKLMPGCRTVTGKPFDNGFR